LVKKINVFPNRDAAEDSLRAMQLKYDKICRQFEAETRNAEATKAKMEGDLKAWKFQLEAQLEETLKKLEEEDVIKTELEESNLKLVAEVGNFSGMM
jgi:hypothetical protein